MNKKTPPNTLALKNLKDQSWEVQIRHYRRWKNGGDDISDSSLRNLGYADIYKESIAQTGGATELILDKDGVCIIIRSTCYYKDNFCRRIGVRECLKKLETLYNIKA